MPDDEGKYGHIEQKSIRASICSVSGMSQCVKRVCLHGLPMIRTSVDTVDHGLENRQFDLCITKDALNCVA